MNHISRGVEGGYVSTGPALKLPEPGDSSRLRWRKDGDSAFLDRRGHKGA